MARDSVGEGRLVDSEDSEEGETLSLCDLPVNLIKEENPSRKDEDEQERKCQGTESNQEDFNFSQCCGIGGGSVFTKQEMCAADDIFFQGQILPLRLSVSSEAGLTKFHQDSVNPSRSLSRSESLDRGGFTSTFSSRSSSSRSQYSSSSASSINTNTRISKPIRIQDHYFHNFPSPKPQIRLSSASLGNALNNRNIRKSSAWDIFRLGLVRTPEIEFQDLKYRSSVSRNSSSSSSKNSNSCTIKSSSSSSSGINDSVIGTGNVKNAEKQRKQRSLWSGCNCSVSAVKPVPLSTIVVKSNNSGTAKCDKDGGNEEEKKQKELKVKKKNGEKKEGKQAMLRHRTFEWIKELSHASFVDDEHGHGHGLDS